jgi:protein-tyrosine phosphatase
MPEVLEWQSVADPKAVARHAARLLHAGRLVALPTDTTYALAASALSAEAVGRLLAATGALPELALGCAVAVRDWAPGLSGLGQRLARRLWPGPLTLECVDGVAQGVATRLPQDVRRGVCPEGALRLRVPAHEAALEVLRHLQGPLVVGPVLANGGAEAVQAGQVLGALGAGVDVLVDDGPSRHGQPATVVRVTGEAWSVVRPGVVSEEQVRQQSACLIVFVCTGNTCRSPLAEALCKKRLADSLGCGVEELPAKGYHVLSAGVAADSGGPAAEEAVEVARRYGADLGGHRSRPLTPELAAQADHLVAMTRGHLRSLSDYYPRLGARPRLLSPSGDIADPIGQSQEVYEECGQQIWRHLEELVPELRGAR